MTGDMIIPGKHYQNRGIVLSKYKNESFDRSLPEAFGKHCERLSDATLRVVFAAAGRGTLAAEAGAESVGGFVASHPPDKLVFDHARIAAEYLEGRNLEQLPFAR